MSISIRPARTRDRDLQVPAPAGPRYEIFPTARVLESVETLPAGAVVTITSSPAKGVDRTIELAEQLAGKRLRPVPHIAARQIIDETELAAHVTRLDAAGVRDVFVVGGDAGEPAECTARHVRCSGHGQQPSLVTVPGGVGLHRAILIDQE